MTPEEMKHRTRAVGLERMRLCERLPRCGPVAALWNRPVRSGTSVGCNYRAACRARSRREFIAKFGIVEEECEETLGWLEMLVEGGYVVAGDVADLLNEAKEVLSMIVASIRTARTSGQSAIRNPRSAIETSA